MESMTKSEIRARIEEIGIIASVRVSNPDYARFAAEAVYNSGIPIAEITLTTPNAIELISQLTKKLPNMVIGAGTVLDLGSARRCVDAGAKFLTSPGLVREVVEFALQSNVVVFPGALTPSEVIEAWKAGSDFVKIFPCEPVGGHHYVRSLKVPLPQVPLIASGGVNQQSAVNFILAGATALGIGSELIPREALKAKQEDQIRELSRRFLAAVKEGRAQLSPL